MKLPLAAVMSGCLCIASGIAQQPASQNQKAKTAGEAFKNIQVLKDVPEDKWFDTMAFIAGSLGVTCDHCHTSTFENDDGNLAKLKARHMMRMVDDINRQNFGGSITVTCNTCHRGTLKPQAVPVPDMEHWMKAAEKDVPLPSADDVLAYYRRSVGIGKSDAPQSQSASFEIATYGGKGAAEHMSVDLVMNGADQVRMTDHKGAATIEFVKNGADAWAHDDKGWHVMDGGELETVRSRTAPLDPNQVQGQITSKAVTKDRVYDRGVYVVQIECQGERQALFFDAGNGLLLRKRMYFSSFYADGSVDLEYADYRRVGGLLIPFTIREINAGGSGLTIRRMTSRRINVPAKAGEFSRTG